jgi:hypothetical protein
MEVARSGVQLTPDLHLVCIARTGVELVAVASYFVPPGAEGWTAVCFQAARVGERPQRKGGR